jgi:glycosyltransferase involved in cell wall biosynthesis
MRLAQISPYKLPQGEKKSGIATYSRNFSEVISPKLEEVVVFSDVSYSYEEYHVEVNDCWQKNLLFLPMLILSLAKSDDFDIYHLQHGLFTYGGIGSAISLLFVPLYLKIRRENIVVTVHDGLMHPSSIDRDFCERHDLIKIPILWKKATFLYFRLLALFSDKIIVHEEPFMEIYSQHYGVNEEKIEVIHHGIQEPSEPREDDGDESLILFFGYLAPYKGAEKMFDIAKEEKNSEIVIAGGKHPSAEPGSTYSNYYEQIKQKVSKMDNVTLTGYITDKEVNNYFKKADLLILPYKDVFGASGPLHKGLEHRTPILASKEFEGILPEDNIFFSKEELLNKVKMNIYSSTAFGLESEIDDRKWPNVAEEFLKLYRGVVK